MSDTAPATQGSRWQRVWHEWRGFVLFIVVMLVFRSAIADWNHVPSGSMLPSIIEGDRIVVDKLAYGLRIPFTLTWLARWAEPQRSDVITFESPKEDILLVKRVVGIPGDKVQLLNNRLVINGEAAEYQPIDIDKLPKPVAYRSHGRRVESETVLGETRSVMSQRRISLPTDRRSFDTVTVPAGHYLVLGDNRDNSADYRFIGFVREDAILGRANSIAFSVDNNNYYLPRGDRFFESID